MMGKAPQRAVDHVAGGGPKLCRTSPQRNGPVAVVKGDIHLVCTVFAQGDRAAP